VEEEVLMFSTINVVLRAFGKKLLTAPSLFVFPIYGMTEEWI